MRPSWFALIGVVAGNAVLNQPGSVAIHNQGSWSNTFDGSALPLMLETPSTPLLGEEMTMTVPNPLAGVSLFVQHAALAAGVNELGIVTSNGLQLTLGDS